jgi:hypothetical protein
MEFLLILQPLLLLGVALVVGFPLLVVAMIAARPKQDRPAIERWVQD